MEVYVSKQRSFNRLMKGFPIQLTRDDINGGNSPNVSIGEVSADLMKKVRRAVREERGTRMELCPDEIASVEVLNGSLKMGGKLKGLAKDINKAFKKVGKETKKIGREIKEGVDDVGRYYKKKIRPVVSKPLEDVINAGAPIITYGLESVGVPAPIAETASPFVQRGLIKGKRKLGLGAKEDMKKRMSMLRAMRKSSMKGGAVRMKPAVIYPPPMTALKPAVVGGKLTGLRKDLNKLGKKLGINKAVNKAVKKSGLKKEIDEVGRFYKKNIRPVISKPLEDVIKASAPMIEGAVTGALVSAGVSPAVAETIGSQADEGLIGLKRTAGLGLKKDMKKLVRASKSGVRDAIDYLGSGMVMPDGREMGMKIKKMAKRMNGMGMVHSAVYNTGYSLMPVVGGEVKSAIRSDMSNFISPYSPATNSITTPPQMTSGGSFLPAGRYGKGLY
jgi:hypothetical protein